MYIQSLSSSQWRLVEENYHWVDKYLKANKYPLDPFYDAVLDALMKAAREYDEQPELHQYAFFTIAKRKMDDAARAEKRKFARRCSIATIISLEEGTPCEDFLDQGRRGFDVSEVEDTVSDRILYAQMVSALTEKQVQVFQLKRAGLTYKEMAARCGIGYSGINSRLYRMRNKLRDIMCALELA